MLDRKPLLYARAAKHSCGSGFVRGATVPAGVAEASRLQFG